MTTARDSIQTGIRSVGASLGQSLEYSSGAIRDTGRRSWTAFTGRLYETDALGDHDGTQFRIVHEGVLQTSDAVADLAVEDWVRIADGSEEWQITAGPITRLGKKRYGIRWTERQEAGPDRGER